MLNANGEVQEEFLEAGDCVVSLEAVLTYKEYQFIHQQGIHVKKEILSPEEENMSLLVEEIKKADLLDIEHEKLILPKEINGVKVLWEKSREYRGLYIICLGMFMGVLLLFKKKEEIKQGKENVKEQMELDYPQIISTFLLYMGAGMTVKNCWEKIVNIYKEKGEFRYAYEEMAGTYQEILNGKSEEEAYQDFGLRMDSLIYRKFALILAQNVKKGTKGIVDILERESQEAYDIRKRKAQSLGERAGTKLLLPMFLMLSVVLCIVVVPAFLSVQL